MSEEDLPEVVMMEEDRITYEIVSSSLQREKEQLVDSQGYVYVKKRTRRSRKVLWRCNVRNKAVYCGATMLQTDDLFTRGAQTHCHPGQPGISRTKKVVAEGNEGNGHQQRILFGREYRRGNPDL